MSMPTGLMVMILASLTVDANLKDIDQYSMFEHGCCVYDQPIWESSKLIWNMEKLDKGVLQSYPYCLPPGQFEVRSGCHYSIYYDSAKEMFSITTVNSNDTVNGDWECQRNGFNRAICSEKPQPSVKVRSANSIFRRIRHRQMQLFASAPLSNYSSDCPWYAGSEDKPICTYDVYMYYTNTVEQRDDELCRYLYFPAAKRFRYVRRCADEPPVDRSKEVALGLGIVITIAVAVGVSLLICICCLCRRRISALLTRSPPTAAQTDQLSPLPPPNPTDAETDQLFPPADTDAETP